MKTLVLVRHAKSSWKDSDVEDHERPLNKRGNRDAVFMAKVFAGQKMKPDLIASSTAVRALNTAYEFAKGLNTDKEKILRVSELYLAEKDEWMDYVSRLDPDSEVAMLFGHNPGITAFVNSLCNAGIENIPTCGIICIQFEKNSWNEITTGNGQLIFFLFPKMYFKDSED